MIILGHSVDGQASQASAGCVDEGTSLPASLPVSLLSALMASHYLPARSPSVRPLDPLDLALRALVALPSPSLSHLPHRVSRRMGNHSPSISPLRVYAAAMVAIWHKLQRQTPNGFLPPDPERENRRASSERRRLSLPRSFSSFSSTDHFFFAPSSSTQESSLSVAAIRFEMCLIEGGASTMHARPLN